LVCDGLGGRETGCACGVARPFSEHASVTKLYFFFL